MHRPAVVEPGRTQVGAGSLTDVGSDSDAVCRSVLIPLTPCMPTPHPRDGNASSPAAQALKSQLVSNLGTQNVTLYAVEGLREVTASIMAGLAFVTTHNLAASLAGSVAVQVSRPAAAAVRSLGLTHRTVEGVVGLKFSCQWLGG